MLGCGRVGVWACCSVGVFVGADCVRPPVSRMYWITGLLLSVANESVQELNR